MQATHPLQMPTFPTTVKRYMQETKFSQKDSGRLAMCLSQISRRVDCSDHDLWSPRGRRWVAPETAKEHRGERTWQIHRMQLWEQERDITHTFFRVLGVTPQPNLSARILKRRRQYAIKETKKPAAIGWNWNQHYTSGIPNARPTCWLRE